MVRKLLLAAGFVLMLAAVLWTYGRVRPPGNPLGVPPVVLPPSAASTAIADPDSGRLAEVTAAVKSLQEQSPAASTSTKISLPARRSAAILAKIEELEPAVKKYAKLHGVDEDLVWAVMRHESGFNPQAVSPKGAIGLMQLMPGTASLMGVRDPYDVEQNIAGGTKYLELCLNQFNQDIALALAAYNAGPQNVTKYQGCPPFAETRQYVAAVLQTYSGQPMYQPMYRRMGFSTSATDEVAAILEKVGLHWRVATPQWKLCEPQVQVNSPRWKGPRRNFALAP